MFPWEHLAVAYLCYSLSVRVVRSRPPATAEAWAVAFGSQLPDLVDKPLAWTFDLLSSGVSLGHSVFVAVPVSLAAVVVARRRGVDAVGAAFALGYLSHLPTDVLYPLAFGGPITPAVLLWPVVVGGAPETGGLFANASYYLWRFVARLGTPRGGVYLLAETALIAAAAVGWRVDGCPGLPSRRGSGDDGRRGSDWRGGNDDDLRRD